ncbi:MAG: hypothetical protein MZV70_73155 [Desulfobacterales bacterium]|nr:hypothetical protein [Desulfobacterales bacterium]
MEHLEIVGIDCHIGSQLTDITPFIDAMDRLKVLIAEPQGPGDRVQVPGPRRRPGHHLLLRAAAPPRGVRRRHHRCGTRSSNVKLIFEPGRVIVGNAGITGHARSSTARRRARRPSSSWMRG